MLKNLFVVSALFVATTNAVAQNSVSINAKDFTAVENSISANVNITQAKDFVVEVIAPQSVIDELNIFVEDGILKLKKKDKNFNWSTDDNKITVNVSAPKFIAFILNGSGNMVAKTPIVTSDLVIKINGSGDVKIDALDATALSVKSNGSGDVVVAGSKPLEKVEFSINGSGDIDASMLASKNASAQINGSGNISAWATGDFVAKIVGSGDIEIKGNPTIDAKVVGSGSLKRR